MDIEADYPPDSSSYKFLGETLIFSFLKGRFNQENYESIQKNFNKNKLLVFVSSTFTDTHLERNILHEEILPELQQLAVSSSLQVIFYDMRFGVRDENTTEHLTWIICKKGIEQCLEESDGLFFLSLQADKYGYMPIPKCVPQNIFETALNQVISSAVNNKNEVVLLAKEWYQLDLNNNPPNYVLKNLITASDKEFYDKVLPTLRDNLLNNVSFDTISTESHETLLVNRSVTEWETLYALEKDPRRCFWIRRQFEQDNSIKDHPKGFLLFDTLDNPSKQLKLDILISKLTSCLSSKNLIFTMNSDVLPKLYLLPPEEQNQARTNYLNNWKAYVKNLLVNEMNKIEYKIKDFKSFVEVKFQKVQYADFEEMIFHHKLVFEKSKQYIERGDSLLNLLTESYFINESSTLSNQAPQKHSHSCVTCAIVGYAGTGKTTVIARLATNAANHLLNNNSTIPIIVRFCGTSQNSLSGFSLLRSICVQILLCYKIYDFQASFLKASENQGYYALVQFFQGLMNQYPVILFIDSIDQLSDQHEERTRLSFFANLNLHPLSKIIISTIKIFASLSSEPSFLNKTFQFLQSKGIAVYEIESLRNEEEIQNMISFLLARQGRSLTSEQMQSILPLVQQEPTVLYIKLAITILSTWKSFDELNSSYCLQPTLKGIIGQIFDHFELNFGKVFTSYALSLITFSREGINDIEIRDCLSLSSEVLAEVFQYSSVKGFPIHVWLRLKNSGFKDLITEREHHCLKWYHNQLQEHAVERYQGLKFTVHQIMSEYFTNKVTDEQIQEMHLQRQPLLFVANVPIWFTSCQINSRRVQEGFYHLMELQRNQIEKNNQSLLCVAEEICSLEFRCASALIGDLASFRSLEMKFLLFINRRDNADNTNNQEENFMKLNDYESWLRKNLTSIIQNPRRLIPATASQEAATSFVKKDLLSLFQSMKQHLTSNWSEDIFTNLKQSAVYTASANHWLREMRLNEMKNVNRFDLYCNLEGIQSEIISIQWNNSFSSSSSIGHSSASNKEAHQNLFATLSSNGIIKIWDTENGVVINTLETNKGFVSMCWCLDATLFLSDESNNHDDPLLLTCTAEGKLKVWNALNGLLVQDFQIKKGSLEKFKGFEEFQIIPAVENSSSRFLSFNHDGTKLLTASKNGRINIFDCRSKEMLFFSSFQPMNLFQEISFIAWNHKSTTLAVCTSYRNNIGHYLEIVDSTVEGKILFKFKSLAPFRVVAWSPPDDALIALGTGDQILIWNTDTWSTYHSFQHPAMPGMHYITSLQWSHHNINANQLIISASLDRTIRVWDVVTKQLLHTFLGHVKGILSLSLSSYHHKLASSSLNNNIKIWKVDISNTASNHLLTTVSFPNNSAFEKAKVQQLTTPLEASISLQAVENNGDGGETVNYESNQNPTSATSVGEKDIQQANQKREISSMKWNQSGTLLACLSEDGRVFIWDNDQGRMVSTISPENSAREQRFQSMVWCTSSMDLGFQKSDCLMMTCSSDGKYQIWNALTTELVQNFIVRKGTLPRHSHISEEELFKILAMHPAKFLIWNFNNSQLLAVSNTGRLNIFDGKTGELCLFSGFQPEEQLQQVIDLDWNCNGTVFAACVAFRSANLVEYYLEGINTVEEQATFRLTSRLGFPYQAVSWSPSDPGILAVAYHDLISIHNIAIKKMLHSFTHPNVAGVHKACCVIWSHENVNHIIAGYSDRAIRIWDMKTKQLYRTFLGHQSDVVRLALSRNTNKLASASSIDGNFKIWSLAEYANDQKNGLINDIPNESWGGMQDITVVAFAPNASNYLITGSTNGMVLLWDTNTFELKRIVEKYTTKISSVTWNKAGTNVVTNSGKVWDPFTGDLILEVKFDFVARVYVKSLIWNPDESQFYLGIVQSGELNSISNNINVYDAKSTGDLVKQFRKAHEYEIEKLAFNPAEPCLLASGAYNGEVIIRNIDTEEIVKKIGPFPQGAFHFNLRWSANGMNLIICNSILIIWDRLAKLIRFPKAHQDCPYDAAWILDDQSSKFITVGNDRKIILWNANTFQPIYEFPEQENYVNSISLSFDGKMIATGGYGNVIKLWDITKV